MDNKPYCEENGKQNWRCVNLEGMKKLKIDVMIMGGARFYKTLVYQYNPLFKIDPVQVVEWVYDKLPSLERREDVKLIFY